MGAKTERFVEVPEGVDVSLDGSTVKVKGEKGELTREFSFPDVSLKKDGNKIRKFIDEVRKCTGK